MMQNEPLNQDLSFLAAVFVIFLCALFGSNVVAIKFSFSGLGVFTTAGIRFSISSLTIYIWARATGQSLALKKGQFHQVLIFAMLFWTHLSLFYFGLSKSNASRSTLIANLVPFLILFLAHIFIPGDRITPRKFFGILLGFAGVAFLFMEKEGVTSEFRIGELLILMGTFIWASSVVYLKKIIRAYNPFQIVLYSAVFSVPLFFLEAFLWDTPMIAHLNIQILCALMYQSLITASFAFVAWNKLLYKYGVVSMHSFVFIMPITGVALGGLVLGEPITSKIIVALALITSGIFVVHWRLKKAAPAYPIRRGI